MKTNLRKTDRKASRAFRDAFKCYDRAAMRAGMTYADRAAALLPNNFMVMRFTPAEIRRVNKAAKIDGWRSCDGRILPVLFARAMILSMVDGILPIKRRRRPGPAKGR